MQIGKKILVLTVLMVFISGSAWGDSQSKPLATGKSFEILPSEVDEMCRPYKTGNAKVTSEQCLNLTLRMRLFAAEAERMGLAKDGGQGESKRMSVVRMKELSELYSRKLMDDFPLADVVITSYYWAHPDQFREKDGSKNAGELKPLNAETIRSIRQIVLAPRTQDINKEEFARLKERYHVKIGGKKKGEAVEKDI